MENLNFLLPELKQYAELLLNNGFRVAVHQKERTSWFYFEKDKQVGYVQFDKYRGFSFGTVHKPNKETGTGFRFLSDKWAVDENMALRTFVSIPQGFGRYKTQPQKYSSIDEYVKRETILKYVIVEPIN